MEPVFGKLSHRMNRVSSSSRLLISLLLLTSFAGICRAEENPKSSGDLAKAPKILPLADIKPGMRGTAYTVFEGTEPEPMDVEVLGVLRNLMGPKSDIILVRLHGQKVEYTGVVAGMSGSPVYIDGKLAGALSLRIGQMSKEPIAGITPIEDMLEINELDKTLPPQSMYTPGRKSEDAKATSTMSGGDASASVTGYARYMEPIAAPLVFNGFSEATLRQFAPQFAAAGVMPVMGAGSSSDMKQPEPMVPGSSVGIVLVRGDMDISATCTVTYMDPERLLACGHPLLQSGAVEMPMTKSDVVATLPSPLNAFKIAMSTETVGSFMQDRHTGVMGRFGAEAHMVPVTLNLHGGPKPKQFHYEMLNNPRLTPVAMMATVFNALEGMNEHGEEISYRMEGSIKVKGYPAVTMEDMFAPTDTLPTALNIALSVGEKFGRIYDNAYDTPQVEGVELDLDLINDHRSARLESARTDVTEARPGDEVVIEAVLKPYRGERIVRRIPVRIPTSTPKGTLRILVSDGDTLDRGRRTTTASLLRKLDLNAIIAALNKEHVNHKLYVSLLDTNPQAMVEDKVMPALPLSVINVMDGMRGSQDMVVLGESAVDESSTPLDYVVSGAQVISLTIK
jgi:hypothetical protein